MNLGSYAIDDLLTFTCNTHTPATGAAVDADSAPGYRVYEDETGTPLLTGSMALLDDANTVGFYSEQITLSAANGFEPGKCYTVRITGVVGGVTGVTERCFQIGAKVDASASAVASVTGPVGSVTGAVGSVTGSVGSVASYGTLVADVATAVWAAGARTLTSFGTLVADIWAGVTTAFLAKFSTQDTGETTPVSGSVAKLAQGAASMTEADIWGYGTRTLTQSAAQVAAVVAGSTLTVQRGDSLSASLTGLGSINGRTKLWFTAKRSLDDADTASIIQIEETDNLVYLNGAAGTAIQGDITVDDEDAGDITITLAAAAAASLDIGSYSYDVQWANAAGAIATLTSGAFVVSGDVTRATS